MLLLAVIFLPFLFYLWSVFSCAHQFSLSLGFNQEREVGLSFLESGVRTGWGFA